jgi:plasmid stabilization system protein ParE
MKCRFALTPEAQNDLHSILVDIVEDNPDTAQRLRTELYEELQKLARFPALGHYHDELLSRRYRFWNFYSYVVVYAWDVTPIRVTSIIHGARDLAALLSLRVERDD